MRTRIKKESDCGAKGAMHARSTDAGKLETGDKSDGSNVGAGTCLLLVRCGDDGEVTLEMMLDANRVRMISVDYYLQQSRSGCPLR